MKVAKTFVILFYKTKLYCFPEKMGHFGLENDASLGLWIHSKFFFEIFHNERGQEVHEN